MPLRQAPYPFFFSFCSSASSCIGKMFHASFSFSSSRAGARFHRLCQSSICLPHEEDLDVVEAFSITNPTNFLLAQRRVVLDPMNRSSQRGFDKLLTAQWDLSSCCRVNATESRWRFPYKHKLTDERRVEVVCLPSASTEHSGSDWSLELAACNAAHDISSSLRRLCESTAALHQLSVIIRMPPNNKFARTSCDS